MASVLVIDDEKGITDMLERMLGAFGHTVTALNDSAQALMTTLYQKFDLVIVDLAMPKLSGEDFLKAFRTGGNHTPVCVFTGTPHAEQLRRMVSDYWAEWPAPGASAQELVDEETRRNLRSLGYLQ